jgi:hypothetical protein
VRSREFDDWRHACGHSNDRIQLLLLGRRFPRLARTFHRGLRHVRHKSEVVTERQVPTEDVEVQRDAGFFREAPQRFVEAQPIRASEYFRRQGAVTITDDVVALNNVEFTGVDCLVWGNDYPHDEGTYPKSRTQIDEIEKRLGPKDARKVLCENAARIFGFDLEYLAANKDEIRNAAQSSGATAPH